MPGLPAHGSVTACPKCGAEEGKLSVIYHAAAQAGGYSTPPGSRWPCRDKTRLGEHLCRSCERCGYGWCEAVLAPEGE